MESLDPQDPDRIGPYRLIRRLGEGGMGRVYLARSDRGRTVAVKVVQERLAREPEFRRRFAQEVGAARKVGGEWTAPVLDADTEAAAPWVATGYVAGPSLYDVVATDHGPLPEPSVLALAGGLVRALEAIHGAGLVHRDLKPSNILVTIDGPRVIDFGIARALDTLTSSADGLTRTGAVIGSPGFMSPEQVRGERVTAASDVFCLGSVLAFAATGRMPFGTDGSGAHALLFRIAQEDPELDGLTGPLLEFVRRCLVKEPDARPSLTELRELADGGDAADPWLPGGLLALLGRRAVQLLEVESPQRVQERAAAPTQTAGQGFGPATPPPYATPHPGGPAGQATPHSGGPATPPHPMGGPRPTPVPYVPVGPTPPPGLRTPPPAGPGYRRPPVPPLRPLVKPATVLLAVAAALQAIELIFHISLYGTLEDDDRDPFDSLSGEKNFGTTLQVFYFLTFVPIAVLWTMWFQRLRLNAERWAPGRLRYTTGLAAGAWYIPVAQLWMPKQIANDIWAVSYGSPQGNVRRGVLDAWWVCWVIQLVVTYIGKIRSDDQYSSSGVVLIQAFGNVATVAAAVLAIMLLHRFTALQERRL